MGPLGDSRRYPNSEAWDMPGRRGRGLEELGALLFPAQPAGAAYSPPTSRQAVNRSPESQCVGPRPCQSAAAHEARARAFPRRIATMEGPRPQGSPSPRTAAPAPPDALCAPVPHSADQAHPEPLTPPRVTEHTGLFPRLVWVWDGAPGPPEAGRASEGHSSGSFWGYTKAETVQLGPGGKLDGEACIPTPPFSPLGGQDRGYLLGA